MDTFKKISMSIQTTHANNSICYFIHFQKNAFKQILILSILIIIMVSSNAFCINEETPKEYSIRFSYGLPEQNYISAQLKDWAMLSMNAEKSLKIHSFPSGQLYKDADIIEAVMTGAIETAMAYNFNLARIVPEFSIFDCPFIFGSSEVMAKVIASPIRQRIDEEVAKKNIIILAYIIWPVEQQGITSTKLLKVPEDAKGMSSRVLGPESAVLWKSWGMNPSFLSGSEVYMALQRGVIQSNLSSVTSNIERKYYEVAPYHTILPVGVVVSVIIANKDFFVKLPSAQQKAMINAGKEVEGKSLAIGKANNIEMFRKAEEVKLTIYHPTTLELKLWQGDLEKVIQEIYKANPKAKADIREIQKMKQ